MSGGRAAALVVLGASLFATVGIAKGLGPQVHDVQLAALRLSLAAAIFTILSGGFTRRVLFSRPILLAGAAQAVFQLSLFTAFSRVGVAVGTLLAIGLAPLVAGLLSRSWTSRWAVSTAMGLVGLALLVGTGGRLDGLGLLAALTAAVALATYVVAISRSLVTADVGEQLSAIFTIGACGLVVPALLVGDWQWVTWPSAWWLVVFLAVVPTVLAYRCYNAGARHLPPASTATFGLVEPVVAAVLGVLVLGESLHAAGVLGAVIIVSAVLLLVRGERAPAVTRHNGSRD